MTTATARWCQLTDDHHLDPVFDWFADALEADEIDVIEEIKAKHVIGGGRLGSITGQPFMTCDEAITNVIIERRQRAEEKQERDSLSNDHRRWKGPEIAARLREYQQWKEQRERREREAREAQRREQAREHERQAIYERGRREQRDVCAQKQAASFLRNHPTLAELPLIERMHWLCLRPGITWTVASLARALHSDEPTITAAIAALAAQNRLRRAAPQQGERA